METEDDKTFSAYQSTTLVTDDLSPPVFGHKIRGDCLVGVVLPLHHTKPGSGMVYDHGTVGRPFDFQTREMAERYWEVKTYERDPQLFENLGDLAEVLQQSKYADTMNEVLAKLRWSMDGSCKIAIFSDTLEARLVAQWYAQKMRTHLRAKTRESGESWNASYQVPLCFYIPKTGQHFVSVRPITYSQT